MKGFIFGFFFYYFRYLCYLKLEDNEFRIFGFFAIGVIIIITFIKNNSGKEKWDNFIEKVTSNLDEITKKLSEGESIEDIAYSLKERKKIPEILSIKLCNKVVENYIEENLIPLIVEEDMQEICERLGLVELLSAPFVNSEREIIEEVENLDENSNVYYMLQDVYITKEGDSTRRRGGTLIIKTRYLFWFPDNLSFQYFLKNKSSRKIIGNLAEKIPFLGLGINGMFLLDSLNDDFSEKKLFDNETINELKETAINNPKFISIPLKEIKSIKFPFNWRQRLINKSFTIENYRDEKFKFESLESGLELVDDMFEQIKMVALLHNKILIPENLDNPNKWIVWE
ncbi:hypothetical protein ACFOS1_18230 [Zunongwangia endophytica]|uniref:Uncharacterized protein n=2 Tax=Zunongwangia endophytica TaxID=1808945 RepID=A0ABV8HBM8_9FLAO